ncbi:MAG: hypothetical protein Q7R30_06225 [Acidobacteriota bacterium]|nr:hypothetical protein [Acidobacteriota bacterium]
MEGHLVRAVAAAPGDRTGSGAGAAVSAGVGPATALDGTGRLRAAGRFGTALAVTGALALSVGVVLAPERAWANVLLAGYALTGLGLAGTFFVALTYASDATWATAFRRVPESMTRVLPAAAVVLGLLFVLHPSLYPWTLEDAAEVGGFKHLWLTTPFFLVRALLYFGVWISFAAALVRNSRRQDEDGDAAWTRRNIRLSAIFLVLFALTCFLASVDWVMSLTPHWYSTMFGVYNFAGLFQSGLATMILIVIWLRRAGPLRGVVHDDHLHDLGKLLFAFSTFWMYIWFSQYMLIWYANIPEETVYFIPRMQGAWQPLMIVNLVLNWAVPLLALMARPMKRHAGMLTKVALAVLVGRWLDLYLMILPTVSPAAPPIGPSEIGAALLTAGLFLRVFTGAFQQAAPVPVKDPFLSESLHYHS